MIRSGIWEDIHASEGRKSTVNIEALAGFCFDELAPDQCFVLEEVRVVEL
jgi:hypothetical protein